MRGKERENISALVFSQEHICSESQSGKTCFCHVGPCFSSLGTDVGGVGDGRRGPGAGHLLEATVPFFIC